MRAQHLNQNQANQEINSGSGNTIADNLWSKQWQLMMLDLIFEGGSMGFLMT